jgi:hypothetical protein
MNTNGLAKLYSELTPWERIAAILAAAARGDEVEAARLWGTARKYAYGVADHHPIFEGFLLAGLIHQAELLDLGLQMAMALCRQPPARTRPCGISVARRPRRLPKYSW